MPDFTIYNINYKNREGQDITIQIHDLKYYDPYAPSLNSVFLTGAARPLVVETFDAGIGDSPFGTIMGKRATISFKSTADYGISTFSEGDDRRFLVLANYQGGGKSIFQGYLLMDDNRERYVPPGSDVFLTAIDGLGTLDGVELTDLNGDRIDPDIPRTRIEYLAFILAKTGLQLPIKVVDNLFNEAMADRTADVKNSPWNQSWLFPKTYEKEVNEYQDCKTALAALMNDMYRIYQYNGDWWVERVPEKKLYPSNSIHYTKFNWDATVNSGTVGDDTHIITIGHHKQLNILPAGGAEITNWFINRASEVTMKRPCKETSTEYPFKLPREILRNESFTRGTVNIPYSGIGHVAYDAENWVYEKEYPPVAQDSAAFIKAIIENGYEKERYMHFPLSAVNVSYFFRNTSKIYVGLSDKIKLSLSYRFSTDLGGGSGHFTIAQAQVRLYGDDGSHWFLRARDGVNIADAQPRWRLSDVNWSTNISFISHEGESENVDFTEWQSVNIESAPVPVDGKIEVILMNSFNPDAQEKDFSSLRLDYMPYINGSYGKFNGNRIRNKQDGNYSFKPVHVLNICESPKVLFKGALLDYDSGSDTATLLSDLWTDWAIQHAGPVYNDIYNDQDKFLKWASLDHYNHYRNGRRKFYVELRNLITVFGHMDLHNLFLNRVNSEHNNNKAFVLTSMVQDWMECFMTGTMIELDDSEDKYAAVDDFVSEYRYMEG